MLKSSVIFCHKFLVIGLDIIAQRIPAIFSWTFHESVFMRMSAARTMRPVASGALMSWVLAVIGICRIAIVARKMA
jgi:hypothetical protein